MEGNCNYTIIAKLWQLIFYNEKKKKTVSKAYTGCPNWYVLIAGEFTNACKSKNDKLAYSSNRCL